MTIMNRSSLDYFQDTRIDLATILRTLFDHKGLIASIVSFFFLLGVAYALLATPVYQANAMIQIEPKKIGIEATPEVSSKPLSVSQAATEIELIKSRAVLGRVVDDLKLNIVQTPRYFPVFGTYMARTYKPQSAGGFAEPVFDLKNYAWGGERISVFQLEVPDALLGEQLTLVANETGSFSLYDKNHQLLLKGQTNQTVEGNGVKIQIGRAHV